ncbi:hypothetical protein FRC03_010876 [Tulasnella sp. 419]|nr:hypothetical protein FRC03_010876 [Tulasnella sp. 419]
MEKRWNPRGCQAAKGPFMLSLRGALPGSACYIRSLPLRCTKDLHSAKSHTITTVAYAASAPQDSSFNSSLESSVEAGPSHSNLFHHFPRSNNSVPMLCHNHDAPIELPPLDPSAFRSDFWKEFKVLLNRKRLTEIEDLLIHHGNSIPPRLLGCALNELSRREAWRTIFNVINSEELREHLHPVLLRNKSLRSKQLKRHLLRQKRLRLPQDGQILHQTLAKYKRAGNLEMAFRAQAEAVDSMDNSRGDRRSIDVAQVFEEHRDILQQNNIDVTAVAFDPLLYRRALILLELDSILTPYPSVCYNLNSSDLSHRMSRLRQSIRALRIEKDTSLSMRIIEELLHKRLWHEVIEHFNLTTSWQTPLTRENYVHFIVKLLHFQVWDCALQLINIGRRQWNKDAWFIEHQIFCLMMMEDLATLKDLPKELSAVGRTPTGGIINNLVRAHLRNNDVESARSVLKEMIESGLPVSDATMEAVIDGRRYMGLDVDLALWISKKVEDPEYIFPTSLLDSTVQLYIQAGYYAMARRLVARYDLQHDPISPSPISPFSEPESIERQRLTKPSSRTWLIIMNLAVRENDLAWAVSTFNRYITSGHRLTTYMANALTRAYLRSGDLITGFSLLASRCRHDTLYSSDTMEPTLTQLQTVVHDLQSRLSPAPSSPPLSTDISSARLNPHAFADFISVVCRRPDSRVVQHTLELAKHLGLCHSAYLLSAALNIDKKAAKYCSALMPKAGQAIDPELDNVDSWTLHKLMGSSIRKERDIIHKRGWLHSWRDLVYPPPADRYSPSTRTSQLSQHSPTAGVIPSSPKSLSTQSSLHLARLSKSLQRKGILPRRPSFAMMIQKQGVHQGDIKGALVTFRVMVERGIIPDNYHYGALMYAYACQGKVEDAERVMRAYEQGLLPSSSSSLEKWEIIAPPRDKGHPVLWEILIYAYGKVRQPELSLLAYNRMVREGVMPTSFTLGTLIKVMLANRDIRQAKQILDGVLGFIQEAKEPAAVTVREGQ